MEYLVNFFYNLDLFLQGFFFFEIKTTPILQLAQIFISILTFIILISSSARKLTKSLSLCSNYSKYSQNKTIYFLLYKQLALNTFALLFLSFTTITLFFLYHTDLPLFENGKITGKYVFQIINFILLMELIISYKKQMEYSSEDFKEFLKDSSIEKSVDDYLKIPKYELEKILQYNQLEKEFKQTQQKNKLKI